MQMEVTWEKILMYTSRGVYCNELFNLWLAIWRMGEEGARGRVVQMRRWDVLGHVENDGARNSSLICDKVPRRYGKLMVQPQTPTCPYVLLLFLSTSSLFSGLFNWAPLFFLSFFTLPCLLLSVPLTLLRPLIHFSVEKLDSCSKWTNIN